MNQHYFDVLGHTIVTSIWNSYRIDIKYWLSFGDRRSCGHYRREN